MRGKYSAYSVDPSNVVTIFGCVKDEYATSLLEGGAQYVRLGCAGRLCLLCETNIEVYRVCPSCGRPPSNHGVNICTCGTWLYMCNNTVSRYIIPNPLTKTLASDDII